MLSAPLRTILGCAVAYGVLAACNRQPATPVQAAQTAALRPSGSLPLYGSLPEFSLLDEEAAPFTRASLHGQVWIAGFIFTSCAMECPRLTARMALLQKRLAAKDAGVHLLSITIAPQTDTPAVLKSYGARYQQEPARWSFLTGKTDPLLLAVNQAYKSAPPIDVNTGNATGFLALHGEVLVLIDGEGRIRGYYGKSDSGLDALLSDAARLRTESMQVDGKAIGAN